MPVRKRADRDGCYEFVIYHGGREIRRSNRSWTKQGAQLAEAAHRQRLAAEEETGQFLADALTHWITESVPRLKDPAKHLSHAKALRPHIRGLTIEEAPKAAQRVKRAMSHLKPGTVNRRLAILRHVCNLAFDLGWTDKQIARRVKLIPENNRRDVYLTPKQVEALADACPRKESAAYTLLAAYTGIRASQLLSLTEANVLDSVIVLDASGKTGKPQIVPIHERITDLVKLLPIPWSYWRWRNDWQEARTTCDLKHVRIHDLRHTWASWLIQSGTDVLTVQKLLGHTDIRMTERDAHLHDDALVQAVKRIG